MCKLKLPEITWNSISGLAKNGRDPKNSTSYSPYGVFNIKSSVMDDICSILGHSQYKKSDLNRQLSLWKNQLENTVNICKSNQIYPWANKTMDNMFDNLISCTEQIINQTTCSGAVGSTIAVTLPQLPEINWAQANNQEK